MTAEKKRQRYLVLVYTKDDKKDWFWLDDFEGFDLFAHLQNRYEERRDIKWFQIVTHNSSQVNHYDYRDIMKSLWDKQKRETEAQKEKKERALLAELKAKYEKEEV